MSFKVVELLKGSVEAVVWVDYWVRTAAQVARR
jgi:hypothetical protein